MGEKNPYSDYLNILPSENGRVIGVPYSLLKIAMNNN